MAQIRLMHTLGLVGLFLAFSSIVAEPLFCRLAEPGSNAIIRIRNRDGDGDDWHIRDVGPDSELYPFARFLVSQCYWSKIVFGCYNLFSFQHMASFGESTINPLPSSGRLITLAYKLNRLIEDSPMYGDQNYAIELFRAPDDTEPSVHIDRWGITIKRDVIYLD